MREPDNEHDKNAVAVYDLTGTHHAAYINRRKARLIARIMDGGGVLQAISIRGTRVGVACEQIAILAAHPPTLARLMGRVQRSFRRQRICVSSERVQW